MPIVSDTLNLDRCPRCGIAKPRLALTRDITSASRYWAMYSCSVCQNVVLAMAHSKNAEMLECLPSSFSVSAAVPERAREYFRQAQETIGQAAASVLMSASAIDAMLKVKGYKDGSLYTRIDKAAADHAITGDMAKWAHQVRLDANDQRHADETASLPTPEDARRCLDFALALADVIFVLPSRVTRGIEETKGK